MLLIRPCSLSRCYLKKLFAPDGTKASIVIVVLYFDQAQSLCAGLVELGLVRSRGHTIVSSVIVLFRTPYTANSIAIYIDASQFPVFVQFIELFVEVGAGHTIVQVETIVVRLIHKNSRVITFT